MSSLKLFRFNSATPIGHTPVIRTIYGVANCQLSTWYNDFCYFCSRRLSQLVGRKVLKVRTLLLECHGTPERSLSLSYKWSGAWQPYHFEASIFQMKVLWNVHLQSLTDLHDKSKIKNQSYYADLPFLHQCLSAPSIWHHHNQLMLYI